MPVSERATLEVRRMVEWKEKVMVTKALFYWSDFILEPKLWRDLKTNYNTFRLLNFARTVEAACFKSVRLGAQFFPRHLP